MNIKAIISDFDGTLIDYYGSYDPRVPELIAQLQKKNVLFSIATGSAFLGDVPRVISELNLSSLQIVNGGGMIINWRSKEPLWHKPISHISTKAISEYLQKENMVFSLETKDAAYMLKILETPAYSAVFEIKPFSLTSIPPGVLKIMTHAVVNKISEERNQKQIDHIMEICKDINIVKFMYRGEYGFDVTSEESTKHTAVLEYAKILDISPNEIVAIGDGYNDYPLFTACGYKIAMGNAPKELQEISDKVFETTDKGGMAHALEHVLSLLD